VPDLIEYNGDMVAQKVYHMRQIGMDWAQIQEHLVAHNYVEHAPSVDELRYTLRSYTMSMATYMGAGDRELLLAMELSRLDKLQSAYFEDATKGDLRAAQMVLNIMAQRAKFTGMDQLNAQDKQVLASVLIVGGDRKAYIEALESGRAQLMAGQLPDDEEELEGEDLER
jgi:hypothetical protein